MLDAKYYPFIATPHTMSFLQLPNPHSYDNGIFFPDNDVIAAGNACRNPDGTDEPWCYHANEGSAELPAWTYCNVPFCPGD